MHLQGFLFGEDQPKPATDSHGPSQPRMQDRGVLAGKDVASSHGPATSEGSMKSQQHSYFRQRCWATCRVLAGARRNAAAVTRRKQELAECGKGKR